MRAWPHSKPETGRHIKLRPMGAITATTPAPEAAVQFLVNGGDMVMIAHHLEVADATFDAIKAAVESGRLPRARLDDAVSALQALPAR